MNHLSLSQRRSRRLRALCQGAMIAALYVLLTLLSSLFGLSSGVIQLRLSEMLCVLPLFWGAAVPGLALGCILANLLAGAIWQDVIFGSLATLLGAIGAYALRRLPWLSPLPTVLANATIVPLVLAYAYGFEGGVGFFALTVGAGEILSAWVLGLLLYSVLRRKVKYLQ